MRTVLEFLAAFCGCYLIGYYQPLPSMWGNIGLMAVWAVLVAVVWMRFWPRASISDAAIDAAQARMPPGKSLVSVIEMGVNDEVQSISVLIGDNATGKTVQGTGPTLDAALAQALAKIERDGASLQ